MMSIGRQVDFHGFLYHIQPCNIDNRLCKSFLQLLDVHNVRRNTRFSPNKSYRKF